MAIIRNLGKKADAIFHIHHDIHIFHHVAKDLENLATLPHATSP